MKQYLLDTLVYLGLGSNLDNPINQLQSALQALQTLPKSRLLEASSFYKNPPVDYLDQPHFINVVAKLETKLPAKELLFYLFEIEEKHHRLRKNDKGPRTLDLDILLYGDEQIDTQNLIVPHPRLKERAFVVYPLCEISPDLILPCGTAIKDLVLGVNQATLERVG